MRHQIKIKKCNCPGCNEIATGKFALRDVCPKHFTWLKKILKTFLLAEKHERQRVQRIERRKKQNGFE